MAKHLEREVLGDPLANGGGPLLRGKPPHSDLHPVVGMVMEGLRCQVNNLLWSVKTKSSFKQRGR